MSNCDGVAIGTDQTVYPQTGVLWARNSSRQSLFCKMQYCAIVGKFSVAPFYNYGAEDDSLIDCYLANYATTPDTKVAVWTANNIAGLKSIVPGVMATGPQSCIDHQLLRESILQCGRHQHFRLHLPRAGRFVEACSGDGPAAHLRPQAGARWFMWT